MRLTTSVIIAVGAIVSAVHAVPNLEERGTYETAVSQGDYSTPTSTSVSPASPCQTHWVTVGGTAGLVYTPEYVNAAVGDVVIFTFGTKNHTLTQSTFAQPCIKMDGGADSGFQPTDGTTSPMFQIPVTTTSPLWFYCMQANHCEQGMVFAINPPATGDKCFQNYKKNAMSGSGTSTVVATATTSVTLSYPAPPAPAMTTISGYNTGTDGQCECVCNIDVSNGAPKSNQGIGVFGGSVGNVQIPWGIVAASASAPAAPAPAAAPAPPPAPYYTTPSYSSTSSSQAATATGNGIGNFANLAQGTVIPFDNTDPSGTGSSSPANTDTPTDQGSSSDNSGSTQNGGFEADGLLGGANGK